MFTVKINTGIDNEEKVFNVCDLTDFRNLANDLFDRLDEALANNKNEDKIELERVLDASDYDNADDLIEWIERMQEIERDLNETDYDDISELTDRIEQLENAIENIYYEAQDVRR